MPLDFAETEFAQTVTELESYRRPFILSPKRMMDSACDVPLVWKKVLFTSDNRSAVPSVRGIYAFVVEHNSSYLPPHGYVMYVGISGDKHARDLRKRYGDYLREKKSRKRSGIFLLLNRWHPCLFFHYAEVEDAAVSLSDIERCILDALIPPFNKKDFSGPILEAIQAF